MKRLPPRLLLVLFGALSPAPAQIQGSPPWSDSFDRLGHPCGLRRSQASARLADLLTPGDVLPFLEALGRTQGEQRLRGLRVLAARADLFPALALCSLERSPDPVRALIREAILALVAALRQPESERPGSFQPLPALIVRIEPRSRTPAQVAGLLARVCEFSLPLIAWPGQDANPWRPTRVWGGDLRGQLGPRPIRQPWLMGQRVHLGRDLIVLAPDQAKPPGTLGPGVWSLLEALASESTRADAAVALGLLPYAPIGAFLLEATGPVGPEWPELVAGLGAFARSLGFSGEATGQAWSRMLAALPGAEGECLAWLACGLATLGPGPDEARGRALAAVVASLPREAVWKALLPLQIMPFPALAESLGELLRQGPISPREAALCLRAASLLGLRYDWETTLCAAALAGPGIAHWAARLVAPLEPSQLEAARGALAGSPGEVALACVALGSTPLVGPRMLMEALEHTHDPDRFGSILSGLRLAGDHGDGSVAPSLLERWTTARSTARLPLAIAIGLLLDAGREWESTLGDPASGLPLFRTWQALQRAQEHLPDLMRLLREAAFDPAQPLGLHAGRALGRLLGLWQSASVNPYLELLRSQDTRERGLVLFQEYSFLSPAVANYLGARAASSLGPFRNIPREVLEELAAVGALRRPPPGAGLALDSEDPYSFALLFAVDRPRGQGSATR